jgi:hypothetical protein
MSWRVLGRAFPRFDLVEAARLSTRPRGILEQLVQNSLRVTLCAYYRTERF